MGREIKFRAWDGAHMIQACSILVDSSDGSVWVNDANIDSDALRCVDFELMQYTGLKDKNGVEIYEGDILIGFNFLNPGRKMPVVFNVTHLLYCCMHDEHIYWINNERNIEVIGNIYENPELLEVSDD